MEVERVPAATSLAETMADEDYPAAAVGKDGTVYVAYLAFTRGKDFQGARERPTTPESGPNTGPLATGEVRKIEKPADFDYLAQPAGGEQIFLRTWRNGTWGEPVAVTDGKQELYRPAVAVDGARQGVGVLLRPRRTPTRTSTTATGSCSPAASTPTARPAARS